MSSTRTSRASELIALLVREGYIRAEPPILQPASIFLDLSGEDLRRRMFLTTDADGQELCLRPDLTIPTARLHLEREKGGKEAAYCYLGPVFRHREQGRSEFPQAGIEIFGRADREAADAEVMARAAEAVDLYGVNDPDIRLGDRALLAAFVDDLEIPQVWRRRILRDAQREIGLGVDLATLAQPANGTPDHSGFLAALDGADPKAAKAVVEDLLSIAGISQVGGRTASDIAERFLEQARLRASAALPASTHEALTNFFAIGGNPVTALAQIRNLIVDSRLSGALTAAGEDSSLREALDRFERRLELLAGRGLRVEEMMFSTAFGRRLDYYTGLVFEFRAPEKADLGPLVGGGRYDGLLGTLGAPKPVPAVGCAIWIERLEEAAR